MSNVLQQPTGGAAILASDVNQWLKACVSTADVGAISFLPQISAPLAPTLTQGSAGNPSGTYICQVVYATGFVRDDGGIVISGFAPGAEATITVSGYAIDWSWTAGPTGTVGVLGYRTAAGGASGSEEFAFWSRGNATLTWTDNAADASLGTGMPTSASTPPVYGAAVSSAVPTSNTTGTYLYPLFNVPVMAPTNPNLLPNPTFAQGSAFWTGIGSNGFTVNWPTDASGPNLETSTSPTGGDISVLSEYVPMGAGVTLSLSAEMLTSGVTAGSVVTLMQAYDATKTLLSTFLDVNATSGQGWKRYSGSAATPANTAYVRVFCYVVNNTVTSSAIGFRRIKLEAGSVATMFTDDQGANPQTLVGGFPLSSLLGVTRYAPTTLATFGVTSTAMQAVSATDLSVSFTAPASGSVIVRLTGDGFVNPSGAATWGVIEHSTGSQVGDSWAFTGEALYAVAILVTGLTPGTAYQFDWGMAAATSTYEAYLYAQGFTGGPPSYPGYAGPATMEVWSA